MKDFDLISIGDATIDDFLEVASSEAEAICNLDKEQCFICFSYASKIPVSKFTRVVGVGNAANNAVGSARLGLKTAIYTVIGSDNDSQEIKKVFEDEGVETDFVVMEPDGRSNHSTVINFGGERNIFVYHEKRNYKLPELPPAAWVYYTSVAEGHEVLHKQIPGFIKKSGAKLAFSPGTHQLKEGLAKLAPILEVTDVLLLNREEAHKLVSGDLDDTKELIQKLMQWGPKIVVITDGVNGSFASPDGREVWQAGVVKSLPVVEMTGAGDAYSTGFLAGQILGFDLPTCMIWGTINAASVVQFIGAREGLLTREGMKEFIAKYEGGVRPKMI